MKKKISAVAAAVLAVSCMTVSASAVQDFDVYYTASADKQSYSTGETATVKVKLENPNDRKVSNVNLKFSLPDGLTAVNSAQLQQAIDSIPAGESVDFSLQVTKKGTEPTSSDDKNVSSQVQPTSNTNDPATSSKVHSGSANNNPSTGSNGYIVLAGMSVLGAALVICLRKKDKKSVKTLALLLSIGVGLYSVPGVISAKADNSSITDNETEKTAISYEYSDGDMFITIPFDSADYKISYTLSYDVDVADNTLSGKVTDAVSGNVLANAKVTVMEEQICRNPENQADNEENDTYIESDLFTTTTDENGTFSFKSTFSGRYIIVVSKDGYNDSNSTVDMNYEEDKEVSIGLSPFTKNDKQLRIVMTWDDSIKDVDSHFTFPKIDGNGTGHIYYRNKDYTVNSEEIINLDLDDTDFYGPETTTVYKMNAAGTYSFYVHDFSNKSSKDSDLLSKANVNVVVYLGNDKIATYKVPENKKGTAWHVFDFDAETLQITPYTDMTYCSEPQNLPSAFDK